MNNFGKMICKRFDGFTLFLGGITTVLIGGVLVGMFVGLTLKDMGYPDHITLLFPFVPTILGGFMMVIGFHYDGKEESYR